MAEKNDIFIQLATISDLLENVNFKSFNKTVSLDLNEENFYKVYEIIEEKYGRKNIKPKDKFTIKIGVVDFIFNKNNV